MSDDNVVIRSMHCAVLNSENSSKLLNSNLLEKLLNSKTARDIQTKVHARDFHVKTFISMLQEYNRLKSSWSLLCEIPINFSDFNTNSTAQSRKLVFTRKQEKRKTYPTSDIACVQPTKAKNALNGEKKSWRKFLSFVQLIRKKIAKQYLMEIKTIFHRWKAHCWQI